LRDWLKKFRDDEADPRRKSVPADLRKFKNSVSDKSEIDWLERFRDDEAEPQTRPRPQRASGAKPLPSPARPLPQAQSRNIRVFEWLMYLSLAVEVATTASDFSKLAELAGGWPVVVLTEVFTLAFFGAFIFTTVYLRKKWALYVIAAFYGFRLLRYIPSFVYIALPLVQFLSAVQFVLQGLALFYAFSDEARAHFAKGKR
jgi:hypothetical protein